MSDVEVATQTTYYSAVRLYLACPATMQVVGYDWNGQMWGLSETIDTTPYGSPRSLASADLDWNGHADLAIGHERVLTLAPIPLAVRRYDRPAIQTKRLALES